MLKIYTNFRLTVIGNSIMLKADLWANTDTPCAHFYDWKKMVVMKTKIVAHRALGLVV